MTVKKVEAKLTGLELLRAPFDKKLIGKLPKPTKAQTDALKAKDGYKKGIRCKICGQWHHPKVVHLDFVGHAAMTDRLLDCDPEWNWEPLAMDEKGLPTYSDGGMWIKLTVCGVTRFGFGSADGKTGGNAVKEIIGDAIRNAAMRFGGALDLWFKGELHSEEECVDKEVTQSQPEPQSMWKGPLNKTDLKQAMRDLASELSKISAKDSEQFLEGLWTDNKAALEQAMIDLPDWYDAAGKAKRKALGIINTFPGDMPVGSDPADQSPFEGEYQ